MAFMVRSSGWHVGDLAVYKNKIFRVTPIGENSVDGVQIEFGHDTDAVAVPTKEFLAVAKTCRKCQKVVVYDDSCLPHMSEEMRKDACIGFVRYHLYQAAVKRTKSLSDVLEVLQNPTMLRLKVPMKKEKLHIRRLAPSRLKVIGGCFSIGPSL